MVSENLDADNVTSTHRHAKESLSGAMETCALVASLPSSVQVRLSTRPERRLVLDSHSCPLSVSNKSGRPGASQRLLLFTDALVLVASSQVTVWPLTVMWVRTSIDGRGDSQSGAGQSAEPKLHCLQVRTPDEEVRMYAQDETTRARWFATINREINRSLAPRSPTASRPSMSQIAPERRYGEKVTCPGIEPGESGANATALPPGHIHMCTNQLGICLNFRAVHLPKRLLPRLSL